MLERLLCMVPMLRCDIADLEKTLDGIKRDEKQAAAEKGDQSELNLALIKVIDDFLGTWLQSTEAIFLREKRLLDDPNSRLRDRKKLHQDADMDARRARIRA